MFVKGANGPDGKANAASIPRTSFAKWWKTDRGEKKKEGVTTKRPIPERHSLIEEATIRRFPRSSRRFKLSPDGAVISSGRRERRPIGGMLATRSNSLFIETSKSKGSPSCQLTSGTSVFPS